MFSKILIANRGEIAVRIIRACREMGIAAVAVHSEADATAPHVLLADEAIPIGPAEAAQSYLSIDRVLGAAHRSGAQAIHPGYGFLAENADFAAACRRDGVVFIGPPADVIRTLGDKSKARRLAAQAGVPIIPAIDEPGAGEAAVRDAALRIGLPVVLKAATGGGGKGMRIVHQADELEVAAASASREAMTAFGDGALIVEKLIDRPRHVEVQILADPRGQVIHLGERECSIQRRHQKVIEETPAPGVNAPLREALGAAAVGIARAAGYVNAGTVEFLLDRSGRFYFLEMNTRLQVEHPVTEAVTGLDLVRAQIRIAAGEGLGLSQGDIRPRGHAIECRIYAEDPEAGFAPSPGRVLYLAEPLLPGVRIDSGVREGQEIPVHYDPILSKIIAWAPDRPSALRRMSEALCEYVVLGCRTNLSYLRALVVHPEFVAGHLFTDFLAEHMGSWKQPAAPPEVAAVVEALAGYAAPGTAGDPGDRNRGNRGPGDRDPWERLRGWRLS
jgi:acetyl-CoA carboxylase biotin carboxylase subunit